MTSPVAARRRRLAGGAVVLSLLVGGLLAATGDTPVPAAHPVVTAQDAVRLHKPAPLALSAPRTVPAGGKIRFAGDVVVKARKPRRVQVDELTARGWRTVAKATSKRTGAFSVRVAAGTTSTTRVFRAEAPATRGLAGYRTVKLRVKVTKTAIPTTGPTIPGTVDYDPAEGLPDGHVSAGSKSDWTYLFDTEPNAFGSRWDPCTVITWTYNPAAEAYPALADVRRAFAKISGVSGLRFKYLGNQQSHRYVGDNDDLDTMTEKMVVGWADEDEFADLDGASVGIGGGLAHLVSGADVDLQMVQGYLTLDNDPKTALAQGFNGSGWGQVMMHEILHALGLGHAKGANQLMFGTATSQNYQFGAGDITGMQKVGLPAAACPDPPVGWRHGRCRDLPQPRRPPLRGAPRRRARGVRGVRADRRSS